MRAIWTEPTEHVEFHGAFWDVPPMDPEPRPAQSSIPILIGGYSDAAIDRAARIGDGWIAARMSAERMSELLVSLRAACDRHGRDLATLTICTGSGTADDVDELKRFAELGVDHLQVPLAGLEELKRFADEVLPRLAGIGR